MARSARRYDLFLPMNYNDGRPVENDLLDAVELRILGRFRGLTVHERQFPMRSIWRGRSRLYLDKIWLVTALDFRPKGSMRFMAKLKVQLLRDFDQEDILITETPLRVC